MGAYRPHGGGGYWARLTAGVRPEWEEKITACAPEAASIHNAMLVSRAAYAGAYSKGENSPYLPLWSYASPSSVTRYVLVAHNSCVLDVNPVGL
jgi:hypothetical protein